MQERAQSKAAKDERRRAAREAAASANAGIAAASATAAESAQSGVLSLSKTAEQQRQSRQDRMRNDKERRRAEADASSRAAAAASLSTGAAADGGAVATPASPSSSSSSSGPSLLTPAAAPKLSFTTEMRPGESFRSYQARIVREKSEKMQGSIKGKKMSDKKKRKLAERDAKKRSRKDPSIDPREARFQAERDAKDAADAARMGASSGDSPTATPHPAKRQRTGATDFASAAPVGFGDIVERPPTLTVMPKSRALSSGPSIDRIVDGLRLMQEGKAKKKGGLKGMDEEEKQQWINAQRDAVRRSQLLEAAKAQTISDLRAQSVAAYKAAKLKRKEEDESANGKAAADEARPYVKKSVLKKQARNRERMRAFKDSAELDIDMEIEMAGGLDD